MLMTISNIHAGWLNFSIGDLWFVASYLTDVIGDITEALNNLPVEKSAEVTLDGEGVYLTLKFEINGSNITVTWEEYENRNDILEFMEFHLTESYTEFYDSWKNHCDELENEYNSKFLMFQ